MKTNPTWTKPQQPIKRNKRARARSVKVEHDGITFDSLVEGSYYLYLKQLREKGVVESFQMQITYVLQDAYVVEGVQRKEMVYTPDFVVTYADGSIQIVDVKGSEKITSRDFPLRQKLFEERYGLRLHVMLWRPRYGGWIERDTFVKKEAQRKRKRTLARKKWEAQHTLLE